MGSSFFALAFRMKYINRWGLMKNTRGENLTEHSAETAMIAHALALIGNKLYGKNYDCDRIAVLALYHDISEIITGDLPTPVKYFNEDIKKSYKQLEKNACETLARKLPDELYDEYSSVLSCECDEETRLLLKGADKLSALIKCTEEVKDGNGEFSKALTSTLEALEKIDLPEIKYFMDNMIPAFRLTLDEL